VASSKNDKKKFKINTSISVFISCVGISFLFWVLIVLSKEYTTYITVKASYENLPEDKMLTYKLPNELRLEVNAAGFVILSNSVFKPLYKVLIDATPPKKIGKYNNGDEFVLELQSQTNQIAEQLGNSLKIKSIFPNTINFYLAAKSQKVVPVKYRISYNFLSQFSFADSIRTSPNKVLLKGPQQILDRINYIETDSLVLNNIKQNVVRVVNFKMTDDLIQLNLKSTKAVVVIPVDKFTETEIEVPISINTGVSNYNIKPFPSNTKVKFLVTLSKYKKVKAQNFKVVALTQNVDLLHSNKLQLQLQSYPPYIKNPTLNPSEVEFILTNK